MEVITLLYIVLAASHLPLGLSHLRKGTGLLQEYYVRKGTWPLHETRSHRGTVSSGSPGAVRAGRPRPLQQVESLSRLQGLALMATPQVTQGNSTSSLVVTSGKDLEVRDNILSFWEGIKPFYFPVNSVDNKECQKDVKDANFLANINTIWAMKMVDSWGKLPDGLLFGKVWSPGMYEECLQVRARYNTTTIIPILKPQPRNYTGRYCFIYYQSEDEGSGWGGVPQVLLRSGLAVLGTPPSLAYGTCIPSTCTTQDMLESVNVTLAEHGLRVVTVACHADLDQQDDLTSHDRAMLSIIGIFGILVFLATLYDVISLQKGQSSREVLLSFSWYNNMRKVFTYQVTSGQDSITCLPGLRVVTMTWIIMCHQYETSLDYVHNTFNVLSYQDPVVGQVITNGWLAGDTFLFLTGLVLAFRLLPYLSARGHIANLSLFLKSFVRRFLRLAPTILSVALFCASLLRWLAYGPRAHLLRAFSQERCRRHWWKDVLFINNYVIGDNHGYDVNDCLENCWYTAVDMQLFLILPILLLPITCHKIGGLVNLSLVTLASVLVPLGITVAYNLPPSPLCAMTLSQHLQYMTRVYLVPWCRAGPWIIGVWTAIFLRDATIARVRIHKVVVLLGYLVAVSLALGLVLGLYPYTHLLPDKRWEDHPAMSAVYGALARPLWGLCVAWVVFTCQTGNADMVNRVLSYPGWRPLARLTFTMYLVAPVVQLWWSTVQYVPTYYNHLAMMVETAGVMVIAGMVALLLTCLVELPIASTLDLLMPSPARTQEALMTQPAPLSRKVSPVGSLMI